FFLDSKSFTTLAEKNAESGRRWNTLSLEQKSRYRDEAAACSTRFSRHNKKREVSRVLKHLEGISEHADMVPGLELMYIAVSGGNHFVGGTGLMMLMNPRSLILQPEVKTWNLVNQLPSYPYSLKLCFTITVTVSASINS
ncbi:hypothetical protein GBAR_LOCUS4603, partial [Geodia barretti]